MTTRSFAAFRQLSVHCDFSEKQPQLKKQLSVDTGFEQWQKLNPALKSTQKSVQRKAGVQKTEGIFARARKEPRAISSGEDDANKRNIKIFLAHDIDETASQIIDKTVSTRPPDPDLDPPRPDKQPAASSRPVSAAAKRRNFQKRLNTVFNTTVKETPKRTFIRSTSAPCKGADQRKSKFTSSRHKLSGNRIDHANNKEPESGGRGNGDSCRVSPVGFYDVETMVSLISPSGSDCEDAGNGKPEKTNNSREVRAVLSLTKDEKSVTFQQSSIHSVRSFSASFPARRASGNPHMLRHKTSCSSQETNESIENKRLNLATIPSRLSTDETKIPSYDMVQGVETIESKPDSIEQIQKTEGNITGNNSAGTLALGQPNDRDEDGIEDFESSKEKQCWKLYSKITKNGINVSFDTILRGMLTPTEYRTRQRSVQMSPISSESYN